MASSGDCGVCGGPLAANNRTGFCTRNKKCKKENKKVHDRDYDSNRRPGRPAPRVPRRYPTHPKELFEDGIIDQIAVEIAVAGTRQVRLTPTERKLVVEKMLSRNSGFREMMQHLGIGGRLLTEILDELGYEIVLDPVQPWSGAGKFLITRKDRKRKAQAGEHSLGV